MSISDCFEHFLSVKFVLTIFSKIFVERDWNSKISQSVQTRFFFEKYRWDFQESSFFLRNAKGGKFALEWV